MDKQRPSIGRVVHYVLSPMERVSSHAVGQHRPGTVVAVFENEYPDNPEESAGVNLLVQLDGANDSAEEFPIIWVTSKEYSAEPKLGTWHWPERV